MEGDSVTSGEARAAHMRPLGDDRSRSVWRWQLMFAISVVAIAATSTLLTPEVFSRWQFLTALFLMIATTLIALGVRWDGASETAILSIAIVDIFTVFLLNSGTDAPVAILWVFPIAWIATYYSTAVLLGSITLISLLLLVQITFNEFAGNDAINFVMLVIALGFIGSTIASGSRRSRSAKRLLRAQARRIESTLSRVTEQKARTQRLLDSLDIGIARVGSEGLLQLANRRFQELYSFDEASQFSLSRAVEYDSRRGTPTPHDQTAIMRASRGELFSDEVIWLFGVDGIWRALRTSTRVIENGDFVGDGLLLVVEEVTDKVDPHASHGAAMRLISHELRNPLTAVLGHVDLLLENNKLPASARRQAEVIERAGDRMQALIDQALSNNAPTPDDGDVEFDLAATAMRSVEAFTPTARSKKLRMKVDLADPLPVIGDAFRVRQVIDNVLSNAIKYSERSGTISVRSFHDGTERAAVEISDTGIGISEEDLPQIFDPDFRAPSALASGIPGTGLGLSISRDITVQCGGSLEVHSELGKGTTVKVTLPVEGRRAKS